MGVGSGKWDENTAFSVETAFPDRRRNGEALQFPPTTSIHPDLYF